MRLTITALLAATTIFACKSSETSSDSKEKTVAKVTASTASEKAAKDRLTRIPITSKSKEASAEFIKARTLMDQTDLLSAEPHLNKALELDPDFAQAHAYLSLIAGADREKNRARATELSAPLPNIEKLFIQAVLAWNATDPSQATSVLTELTAAAPGSPRAHLMAASLYEFRAQQHAKAIEHAKRAIELDATQAEAFNILAYAYRNQGKLDEAIKAAQKQVELLPKDANPVDTLADIQLAAGQLAEAEANYRKAFAADETYSMSLASAGVTQLYRFDFDGAAATFAEADRAEKDPRMRFGRVMDNAMIKAIAGDKKGALAAAAELAEPAKTHRFDPTSTVAMARARIHIHANDWKAAHKQMGVAVEALANGESRDDRAGFTYMARVLTSARVGDKAAAQTAFAAMEEKIKSGPPHTLAAAHMDWLAGDIDAALAKFDSLKGGNFHAFSCAAAADMLDGAKRSDEADAKRKQLLGHYSRNTDEVMVWLQHSKPPKKK